MVRTSEAIDMAGKRTNSMLRRVYAPCTRAITLVARDAVTAVTMKTATKTALRTCQLLLDTRSYQTYYSCAVVGLNIKFDPMLTVAMSCTAHPHSVAVIAATKPMVLESVVRLNLLSVLR